ncbi:MAG: cytochrome c biogenesis protein CcdA [Oscillospiraceae bacterium]|nr:cytochrome c biogenesis protein CcdA [Oscillospiraceae bacterium]
MVYLLTFSEGVLAFLSPCVLPLAPVYVAYFTAGKRDTRRTGKNALGFVLGLFVVLVALGLFMGALGTLLGGRRAEVLLGGLLILFGLHYFGLLSLPTLAHLRGKSLSAERLRTLSFPWAVALGATFALCWTPCIGPLLGAALVKASRAGGFLEGGFLLVLFALGMGLPFLFSALLLDRVGGLFAVIKRHYGVITRLCGVILTGMGAAMVLGLLA